MKDHLHLFSKVSLDKFDLTIKPYTRCNMAAIGKIIKLLPMVVIKKSFLKKIEKPIAGRAENESIPKEYQLKSKGENVEFIGGVFQERKLPAGVIREFLHLCSTKKCEELNITYVKINNKHACLTSGYIRFSGKKNSVINDKTLFRFDGNRNNKFGFLWPTGDEKDIQSVIFHPKGIYLTGKVPKKILPKSLRSEENLLTLRIDDFNNPENDNFEKPKKWYLDSFQIPQEDNKIDRSSIGFMDGWVKDFISFAQKNTFIKTIVNNESEDLEIEFEKIDNEKIIWRVNKISSQIILTDGTYDCAFKPASLSGECGIKSNEASVVYCSHANMENVYIQHNKVKLSTGIEVAVEKVNGNDEVKFNLQFNTQNNKEVEFYAQEVPLAQIAIENDNSKRFISWIATNEGWASFTTDHDITDLTAVNQTPGAISGRFSLTDSIRNLGISDQINEKNHPKIDVEAFNDCIVNLKLSEMKDDSSSMALLFDDPQVLCTTPAIWLRSDPCLGDLRAVPNFIDIKQDNLDSNEIETYIFTELKKSLKPATFIYNRSLISSNNPKSLPVRVRVKYTSQSSHGKGPPKFEFKIVSSDFITVYKKHELSYLVKNLPFESYFSDPGFFDTNRNLVPYIKEKAQSQENTYDYNLMINFSVDEAWPSIVVNSNDKWQPIDHENLIYFHPKLPGLEYRYYKEESSDKGKFSWAFRHGLCNLDEAWINESEEKNNKEWKYKKSSKDIRVETDLLIEESSNKHLKGILHGKDIPVENIKIENIKIDKANKPNDPLNPTIEIDFGSGSGKETFSESENREGISRNLKIDYENEVPDVMLAEKYTKGQIEAIYWGGQPYIARTKKNKPDIIGLDGDGNYQYQPISAEVKRKTKIGEENLNSKNYLLSPLGWTLSLMGLDPMTPPRDRFPGQRWGLFDSVNQKNELKLFGFRFLPLEFYYDKDNNYQIIGEIIADFGGTAFKSLFGKKSIVTLSFKTLSDEINEISIDININWRFEVTEKTEHPGIIGIKATGSNLIIENDYITGIKLNTEKIVIAVSNPAGVFECNEANGYFELVDGILTIPDNSGNNKITLSSNGSNNNKIEFTIEELNENNEILDYTIIWSYNPGVGNGNYSWKMKKTTSSLEFMVYSLEENLEDEDPSLIKISDFEQYSDTDRRFILLQKEKEQPSPSPPPPDNTELYNTTLKLGANSPFEGVTPIRQALIGFSFIGNTLFIKDFALDLAFDLIIQFNTGSSSLNAEPVPTITGKLTITQDSSSDLICEDVILSGIWPITNQIKLGCDFTNYGTHNMNVYLHQAKLPFDTVFWGKVPNPEVAIGVLVDHEIFYEYQNKKKTLKWQAFQVARFSDIIKLHEIYEFDTDGSTSLLAIDLTATFFLKPSEGNENIEYSSVANGNNWNIALGDAGINNFSGSMLFRDEIDGYLKRNSKKKFSLLRLPAVALLPGNNTELKKIEAISENMLFSTSGAQVNCNISESVPFVNYIEPGYVNVNNKNELIASDYLLNCLKYANKFWPKSLNNGDYYAKGFQLPSYYHSSNINRLPDKMSDLKQLFENSQGKEYFTCATLVSPYKLSKDKDEISFILDQPVLFEAPFVLSKKSNFTQERMAYKTVEKNIFNKIMQAELIVFENGRFTVLGREALSYDTSDDRIKKWAFNQLKQRQRQDQAIILTSNENKLKILFSSSPNRGQIYQWDISNSLPIDTDESLENRQEGALLTSTEISFEAEPTAGCFAYAAYPQRSESFSKEHWLLSLSSVCSWGVLTEVCCVACAAVVYEEIKGNEDDSNTPLMKLGDELSKVEDFNDSKPNLIDYLGSLEPTNDEYREIDPNYRKDLIRVLNSIVTSKDFYDKSDIWNDIKSRSDEIARLINRHDSLSDEEMCHLNRRLLENIFIFETNKAIIPAVWEDEGAAATVYRLIPAGVGGTGNPLKLQPAKCGKENQKIFEIIKMTDAPFADPLMEKIFSNRYITNQKLSKESSQESQTKIEGLASALLPPFWDCVSWAVRPGEKHRTNWQMRFVTGNKISYGPAQEIKLRSPRSVASADEKVIAELPNKDNDSFRVIDGRFWLERFKFTRVLGTTPFPKDKEIYGALITNNSFCVTTGFEGNKPVPIILLLSEEKPEKNDTPEPEENNTNTEPNIWIPKLTYFAGDKCDLFSSTTLEESGLEPTSEIMYFAVICKKEEIPPKPEGYDKLPKYSYHNLSNIIKDDWGSLSNGGPWVYDKSIFKLEYKPNVHLDDLNFCIVKYNAKKDSSGNIIDWEKNILQQLMIRLITDKDGFRRPTPDQVAVMSNVDNTYTLAGYKTLDTFDKKLFTPLSYNPILEEKLLRWEKTATVRLLRRCKNEVTENLDYDISYFGSEGEKIPVETDNHLLLRVRRREDNINRKAKK